MKKHEIDFNMLLTKGNIIKEIKDGLLFVTTTKRLATKFDNKNMKLDSYLYLQDSFKLPIRIDFTVKIDSPCLYLILGNGHLSFGSHCSDNRRIDDIIEPNYKPRFFHDYIPMNEFVDISVIYGLTSMQILINGEERFYSEKEKYMKSKLLKELNDTGFKIKISCAKRVNLFIKSLSVTEYEQMPEILHSNMELPKALTRNEAVEEGQKPNFERMISLLPSEIQNEIIKTDDFLRKLKPMKFKRILDKNGSKITYLASEYGFSYSAYISNDIMYHSLWWYIITNGKPEFWHRKADMMEATLNKIAETSPEFASRMFSNLTECIACCPCLAKTLYEFNGKKKLACHGMIEFKMCVSDFADVREFINTVNELIVEEQLHNIEQS